MRIISFILCFLFVVCSQVDADITGVSGTVDHGSEITISGAGFGTKTDYSETRSNGLMWIWDNAEDVDTFADAGWTTSQCVPNLSTSDVNLTYSGVLHSVPMAHSNSTKYGRGVHASAGFNTGGTVAFFAGGAEVFTKVYARWYYYEEAPFTNTTDYNVAGTYDMRNNKNLGFQDRDSLYAGGGTGISYNYIDNNGLTIFTTDFAQIWIPNDAPLHTSRGAKINGFGTTAGDTNASFEHDGLAGFWDVWEVEAELGTALSGSVKLWINGTEQMDFTNDANPFDVKGFAVGGFRDRPNSPDFVKYFDDMYVDKGWERVTITGTDGIPEIQIPTEWADGSVTVNVNLGELTDGENATLNLYKTDGTAFSFPVTVGRSSNTITTSITGTTTITGGVTIS